MWSHGPRWRAPLRFERPAFITVCGATNKRPVNEQMLDGTVVELMMPVQSRRQGDDLLVDNVDLKRAARNLLNKTRAPGWTPPGDLNQAMELMASCFGYANLLAANEQARRAPAASAAPTVLAEGMLDKMKLQAAGVPNVVQPEEVARRPWGPVPFVRQDGSVLDPDADTLSKREDIAQRLATARRDGRTMVRIGMGLEDLTARADALAATGPESARATLENATTRLQMQTVDLSRGTPTAIHPAPDTFPADCCPKFDQRWRNLASTGFYSCLADVAHNRDIVAIIGRRGSGTSLLVNAMAKSKGGAVVNFGLKTAEGDFDRMLEAPPKLCFFEEFPGSGETRIDAISFAAGASTTKAVFVLQDYEALRALFEERNLSGQPILNKAVVLDLDRMTLNTVYAEQPMAIDRLHHELLDEPPRYRPGAAGNPMWVRLQFECVGNYYEAEMLPDDLVNLTDGAKPGAEVRRVTLAVMRASPNGVHSVEEAKAFTAQEWDRFIATIDPASFHRECTASGYIDIGRAMELSGFRTAEQNAKPQRGPTTSAHAPSAARRKHRP